MFKSWRSDKKKFKAVFKLQFQATQVPRLKKSAVMISLVPEDVGKPTFKLEKVPVLDGICSWENPIFVSVKLIKEQKTGIVHEKIYHFIVATGSSKSGFLGEASIDFADFVAGSEAVTVSLPLKFANSGAVLHVTIQKLEGDNDQGCIEETADPSLSNDGSFKSQLSNQETDADDNHVISENNPSESNFNQNHPPHRPTSTTQKTGATGRENGHRRTATDWSLGSASDGSFVEDSNDSVEKLKSEITALMRQTELSELEIQSLRKQVLKENKRAQDLSRQIITLTEEKDELDKDYKQLKMLKRSEGVEAESQLESVSKKSSKRLLEEIREELDCEKDLSANLRLQMQRTQDSNSNLILAVRDLNEMLEEKNREISQLSSELESINEYKTEEIKSNCDMFDNEHQQNLIGSSKYVNDADEIEKLKQTINDLYGEIDFSREQGEEVEMQYKQLMQKFEKSKTENRSLYARLELQSDALATIEELESHVESLEDKLRMQSLDNSESVLAINELESQVKGLKKELEEQSRVFQNDLEAMVSSKTEQEHRAIQAEETLRKTRWETAETAEQFQEEFRRFSVEMESKLDENEKSVMRAVAEANELRREKITLEEMLQKANSELEQIKDQNAVKLEELLSQIEWKGRQIEQLSLELGNNSKEIEYAQQHDTFSMEIEMLRAQVEKLNRENRRLRSAEEAAIEQTKTEAIQIQRWNEERNDWEKKISVAKKEAEKAQEQVLAIKSLKDGNEATIRSLQSKVEILDLQYNELKSSFTKEEMEKETLRKQLVKLKGELQKKDEAITIIKKNLKNNSQSAVSDVIKTNSHTAVPSTTPLARLEEARSEEGNLAKLLKEITFLKERNKSMESDLNEMQERYSEISLKFAEVEGERQKLVMMVRNLKNGKKN